MPKKKLEEEAMPRLDKTTRQGFTTLAIDVETLDKLKDIAYWDRMKLKDVVRNFLRKQITAHEQERGKKVKPRPKDETI